MQVHFTIDQAFSKITLELMGTPRPGELHAFAKAIAAHVDFKSGMPVLIDARELKALPDTAELAGLVNDFRRLRAAGTVGRTAIVMEGDMSVQLARALQVHVGITEPQIAAFTTPERATEWIEADASDARKHSRLTTT